MASYTDNPSADWDSHCDEQEAYLERMPRCSRCHERIEDEKCYEFNGTLLCRDCVLEEIDEHEVRTADYAEEM